MAIRNVYQEGEPILRKTAREVTEFNERLYMLLDDMKDTLHVQNGVGLAAPQVGISRRVIIIEPEQGGPITEMINPVILSSSGSQTGIEGCLSVDPSKNGEVTRPMNLTVSYKDRFGGARIMNAEGFTARVICHETDHLNGVLFIDRKLKRN